MKRLAFFLPLFLALVMLMAVMPAFASKFTLEIFGNANMDDDINQNDVAYVEGVIKGINAPTNLSDANYDGKVDLKDIDQIKNIMSGTEKELTIIDFENRTVTISKPVNRVITLHYVMADALRILGAKDKIVGIGTSIATYKIYLQGISELPTVGSYSKPDVEAILRLKPDIILTYHTYAEKLDEQLPDNNVPIVGFSLHDPTKIREEIIKLGYIFDKKQEVEKYLAFHDKYIGLIEARTEGLSEEKKSRIFLEVDMSGPYRTYGGESYDNQKIVMAGGRNIFADILGGESTIVDPEAVVSRNPNIIILKQYESNGNLGYEFDDSAGAKSVRVAIMSRPELADVDAVKNGCVYIIGGSITIGPPYPVCVAYYAKWLYPNLFKDLDPQAIHQEYIDEFCGLDYNVSKHGIFAYSILDGN